MLDRAACAAVVRFSSAPFVSVEALSVLCALLDQVLSNTAPSSNARLPSASGVSRDQNQGETDGAEDDGGSDRESAQAAQGVAAGAPNWLDLPKGAREALIGLMTRLILAHAQTTTMGAGHDH